MVDYLEKSKLLRSTQHGYVKNKSCLISLLVEEVTNYLDS